MTVVNNGSRSLHYATAGDVQTGRLILRSAVWSGMTTDGHTMTMKDSAGNIVAGPYESSANFNPIYISLGGRSVNGLEVDVLGSGVVDVILG